MDTGHILSGQSGQIDLLEFVQQYYSRLSEIHLHDGALNPVEGKKSPYFDHQILGQGDLPIVEFLSDLEAKKFDGPIIFELTRTQAVESLEVIRKLLPNLTIN